MKVLSLSAMLLVVSIGMARAEVIIDADTTIDYAIDDSVRVVDGLHPPTTVDITEQADINGELTIWDSSVVNMTGGAVRGSLEAHDSAAILLFGGSLGDSVHAYDDSTLNLSAGACEVLDGSNSSTVNVSGGYFEIVGLRDSSTMTVSGGDVSELNAHNFTTLTVTGGELSSVRAEDSSIARILGGTVSGIRAGDRAGTHSALVTIDGHGFNFPYGEIPDASGTLTGTLANGDPIDASFRIYSDASIVLVPEPGAVVSLSMLLVVLAVYMRRRCKPSSVQR